MEQYAAYSPHPLSRLVKWLIAIVAIIIIATIFFGGYGGLQHLFGLGSNSAPADLQGTLLLSAMTLSTSTGAVTGIVPTLIDAPTGKLSYLPADQMTAGPAVTLQYDVSSDNAMATFLGTPASSDAAQAPSVFRANLSNAQNLDDIVGSLQAAAVAAAPTAADYFREAPAISTNGEIAYSSLSEKQFDAASTTYGSLHAEDWNIYAVSEDGATHMLTHGLYPKWTDATHFAFLKNDGVYYYDLESGQETKVVPLSFTPNLATGFDVSDDSALAAVSNPAGQSLTIYRALDWASGLLSTLAQVPVVATYPIFSPDDHYLAVFELTANPDDAASSVATLRYLNLTTQTFLSQKLSFDPAAFSGLYLTDWR